MIDKEKSKLACSFCGKTKNEVIHLVAKQPQDKPAICDECIMLSLTMFIKETGRLQIINRDLNTKLQMLEEETNE